MIGRKYCIGEKNLMPTWDSDHKFRLPDASGGPGIKLWPISINPDANIETICKSIVQRIATPQRDQ